MTGNITILKQKLNQFIKKYYINELIKGLFITLSVVIIYFLFAVLLEYQFNFPSQIRKTLFFLLIAIVLLFASVFVLKPLLKYFGFLKPLSEYDAAKIIGNKFTEVQDKLLNVLQLNNQASLQNKAINFELLNAGIDQKINELKPVPFSNAVDFNENKKYITVFAIPFFIFLLIWIFSPSVVTTSTEKLINYNTEFLPKAPFQFKLLNTNLSGIKGEPFEIKLQVNGKLLPKKFYVEINGVKHAMTKNNDYYSYTAISPLNSFKFRFYGGGFYSKEYNATIYPKPTIAKFDINLEYPAYLKMTNQTLYNVGNISVPEGTKIQWKFYTQNTSQIEIIIADSSLETKQSGEQMFTLSQTATKSFNYKIIAKNKHVNSNDTIFYSIEVIKDQYPKISVESQTDTLTYKIVYCKINLADDYGFTALKLFVKSENNQTYQTKKINLIPNQAEQILYYEIRTDSFFVNDDDSKLEYYFQVWDNDKLHGYKSAKTFLKQFKKPTFSEIADKTDKNNETIKEKLNESLDDVKKLKQEIAELKKSLFEKTKPDWQDQKKIEQLMQKEQQLEKQLNEVKNINKQNQLQNQDLIKNENILEKQQILNELFDKVMTEEMKKMYEELQKMLEELNKNKLEQEIEKSELSAEDLEKELDRSIELFKQLEVEQKAEQIKNQLEKLAQKQEELAEKTKKSNKNNAEQLKEEQNKINKAFNDLQKELSDLEKMNNELENKKELGVDKEKQQAIENELNKAAETLNSNKPKKAAENQKSAAQQMQEMAQQMQQSASNGQQQAEDLEALKQILKNLIESSFRQEDLMNKIQQTKTNDPQFIKLVQEQKRIQENTKIIKDSLYALSKRVFQISHIINKELTQLDNNLQKSIAFLADRKIPVATARQQSAMTNYNNLALLLDEALQQMQKQMQQQAGKGQCKKPGGNSPKPSVSDIKKMQQQMAKQLEGLKKALEGKKKPGQKPGQLPGKMSKQMAQMAAQQAAIRQKLQELQNQLESGNKGAGAKKLKEISDLMEQTEKDIVNNNVTNETLKRQQEILTRLLESEKAEREQDQDNKRKSQTAQNIEHKVNNELEKYFKKSEKQTEYLKTINPNYKLFYKKKVNQYFLNLSKQYE